MSRLTEFFIGFRNSRQDLKPWGISKFHFLKSEWEEIDEPTVSWCYLIWRGCYALFCVFTVIFSICISTKRYLWLIFLTRWSLTCQLVYSFLYFMNLLLYVTYGVSRKGSDMIPPADNNDRMSRDHSPGDPEFETIDLMIVRKDQEKRRKAFTQKNNAVESVVWILTGIVGSLPIFVSIGYWTLVYPTVKNETTIEFAASVLVHGVNAIFSLIDTMVNAIPVRVTQFVYLLTFGLTYAVFSGLYEVVGGEYVSDDEPYLYAVLNWRQEPRKAFVSSALAIPTVILLYYVLWFLYILRLRLVYSCSSRRDRESCHYLHQYWLHKKIENVAA
ncbi:unnamed protein product [Allacma fusca]|uniref:Protein rolling stone n=1 Tax=Allacma fusca TaxID=39272 RepID=A0A8J2KU09_9HEXA|nr:unnamed protein product [Allacma fusca]